MKDEFISKIGIWGQRHYDYMKKYKPTVINVMRMDGTLENYLRDVDKNAVEMLDQLIKQMAKAEGITEQLKAENQMLWVGRMENIHNRAMEIVNEELIYV